MNKDAQRLGRLARGKPKRFTATELERRKKLLTDARKKRWPKCRSPVLADQIAAEAAEQFPPFVEREHAKAIIAAAIEKALSRSVLIFIFIFFT